MAKNGWLTPSQLATAQGHIKLEKDTAYDYKNMDETAALAGVQISIAEPLGGYRSFADQAALKADPLGHGSKLKSSQIAAAGNSTHGFGQRVDIVGDGALEWVIKHGKAFGFRQRDPKNDPNCFTHAQGRHSKPPLGVKQRRLAHDSGVYSEPSRDSRKLVTKKRGEVFDMVGYVTGQKIDGASRWYVTKAGNYMLAARFTRNAITGLKAMEFVKPTPVPPVVPPVTPAPPVTTNGVDPVPDPVSPYAGGKATITTTPVQPTFSEDLDDSLRKMAAEADTSEQTIGLGDLVNPTKVVKADAIVVKPDSKFVTWWKSLWK